MLDLMVLSPLDNQVNAWRGSWLASLQSDEMSVGANLFGHGQGCTWNRGPGALYTACGPQHRWGCWSSVRSFLPALDLNAMAGGGVEPALVPWHLAPRTVASVLPPRPAPLSGVPVQLAPPSSGPAPDAPWSAGCPGPLSLGWPAPLPWPCFWCACSPTTRAAPQT